MFTGIIQTLGTVKQLTPLASGKLLVVDAPDIAADVKPGDSVAVNGVCLTAAKIAGSQISFDVSPESLEKSTTGLRRAGECVNLELAMAADGRFGGHIVQGHVDGQGRLRWAVQKGDFWDLTFDVPANLAEQIILKGSIAVDGISLTVAKKDAAGFSVAVIPETWKKTNLSKLKPSDPVNIETDIVVKVITARVDKYIKSGGSLSIEKLRDLGF
jgi:riboflavin synthase